MKLFYNDFMSRIVKQVVYGGVYLCIFFGIAVWVYFLYLKPAPTCFDNIQNQGEQGIDCGGPCAKVCTPTDIQPITVNSVATFRTSPNHVTFLASLTNVNQDFAARNFDYRFDLHDATGTVIQSFSGQSFIYAGEVKFLILPNMEVSSSVSSVTLTAVNPEWIKGSDFGAAPQFVFRNEETKTMSSSTIGVSGTVTNEDVSAFNKITVVAIFKDAEGSPVGASQTELDNIAANGTYDFSVIYPSVQNVDLTATEVEAYGVRL